MAHTGPDTPMASAHGTWCSNLWGGHWGHLLFSDQLVVWVNSPSLGISPAFSAVWTTWRPSGMAKHGETWPLSSIIFHEKTSLKCRLGPFPAWDADLWMTSLQSSWCCWEWIWPPWGFRRSENCFGDRVGNCFQHRGCEGFWILATLVETASAMRYGALR
jgi:hypothetical protein